MRAFALITLPPESWGRGRHGLERPHRRELHDQRLGRGGPEFSAHALRIQSGDRGPGPRTARRQFREIRTAKSLRLR
jgi:hypothetical protein